MRIKISTSAGGEYRDSAEFSDDMSTAFQAIQKATKIVKSQKWDAYMKITDENFGTKAAPLSRRMVAALTEAKKAMDALDNVLLDATEQ